MANQNSISMAKPTSVITRSNPQTLDSRSPGVSQSVKANAGAKKTIDLTSKSGGKPEVSLFFQLFSHLILAQVIDLDGDEVKKSESVIGGGEDTVSCLLHFYIYVEE